MGVVGVALGIGVQGHGSECLVGTWQRRGGRPGSGFINIQGQPIGTFRLPVGWQCQLDAEPCAPLHCSVWGSTRGKQQAKAASCHWLGHCCIWRDIKRSGCRQHHTLGTLGDRRAGVQAHMAVGVQSMAAGPESEPLLAQSMVAHTWRSRPAPTHLLACYRLQSVGQHLTGVLRHCGVRLG